MRPSLGLAIAPGVRRDVHHAPRRPDAAQEERHAVARAEAAAVEGAEGAAEAGGAGLVLAADRAPNSQAARLVGELHRRAARRRAASELGGITGGNFPGRVPECWWVLREFSEMQECLHMVVSDRIEGGKPCKARKYVTVGRQTYNTTTIVI